MNSTLRHAPNIGDPLEDNNPFESSELLLRQITQSMREVFWMIDAVTREVIYISPSYETVWGRSCQSLYASPRGWMEAIHADDQKRILQASIEKQAKGNYDEVYRVARPDGSIRWIHERAFPMRDEFGKIDRITGMAEDITPLKRLEKEILEVTSNERRRIGHELHDGLGQHLAAIAFKAKELEQSMMAEQAWSYAVDANKIVQLLTEAVSQTRRLASALDAEEFESIGLVAALKKLVAQTQEVFEIACDFHCAENDLPVKPDIALALYRIAQEAIHNALEHGKARQIKIELGMDAQRLHLTVHDFGQGFKEPATESGGMGLRVMQHRANSIGAILKVSSQPDYGTLIHCQVPRSLIMPVKGREPRAMQARLQNSIQS